LGGRHINMKKLLAPITLLFLVACQPSELEGCLKANIGESDYLNKFNTLLDELVIFETKYEKIIEAVQNDSSKESTDRYMEILVEFRPIYETFSESLTVLEKKISDRHPPALLELSAKEQKGASQQQALKESISKVILDEKDIATGLCHAQGIY